MKVVRILRLKLEKHCLENRPDDTKLWIERCEEGEKIMRMPPLYACTL